MRSAVALQAKKKDRERNNHLGPKFEDMNICLLR